MIDKAMPLPTNTPVRIERDEKAKPSKGTWPKYKGKRGVIARIFHDVDEADDYEYLEYGVVLGVPHLPVRPDGKGIAVPGDAKVVWFQPGELVPLSF